MIRALALALGLGFVAAYGAQTTVAPAADVAAFVDAPDFTQVSLSPDGRYVAALAPRPGHPETNLLVIFSSATSKPLRTLNPGSYQLIGSYTWVGEHRIVASLATQLDGLDTPVLTGELYGVDADGRRAIDLFGFRARPGSLTGLGQRQAREASARVIGDIAGDPDHVLIATRPFGEDRHGVIEDIERLNVLTGATRRLGAAPAADAELLADHAGQVRAAWASDDLLASSLWLRPDNHATWTLANDPASSGEVLIPLGFNHDNSGLYIESSRKTGPGAIELLDMRSGKRTLLYRGRFADVDGLLANASGDDFYAIVTADGPQALHYLQPEATESALNRTLAGSFPGRLAYLSSFSRDGHKALIHVVSDRNPGDTYLFDVPSRQAHFLLTRNARIDPLRMRPRQPIALRARDGVELHGFLTLPAGGMPHPMVVVVHGGPFGVADNWRYDPEAQLFASRGYAVLQVNFRGSGGYGAHFETLGFRQWGQAMEDDVLDATRWAVAQGYADPARLCIYGASYGGFAAMEAVVREPGLFKCAIGYAGVYDMRVQLDRSDTAEIDAGRRFLAATMGEDRTELLKHSPLSGVGRIRARLLLIHGGKDRRVPFRNFVEFTQALRQAHRDVETLTEPDEGHGFYVQAHREAAYRAMLAFLARAIGPDAAPAASP